MSLPVSLPGPMFLGRGSLAAWSNVPSGGSLSRGFSSQGDPQTETPPPHGKDRGGGYTSYWNVFLYLAVLSGYF